MAKIQQVKAARASSKPRRCRSCQHEVQPGESYQFIDKKTGPRSSLRLIWCRWHQPRLSDTLSGRAADLARITEAYADEVAPLAVKPESLEALADALEQSCNDVRDLANEIREGAESLEAGFNHPTAQSEAMQETAEALDEWAERLESQAQELRNWEPPEDEDSHESIDDQVQGLFDDADNAMSEEPELNLTG